MNRREQLQEIEGWGQLLEQVQQFLQNPVLSRPLTDQQRAERLQRLDRLKMASARLKENIALTSPFAVEPTEAVGGARDKLEQKMLQEIIAAMRIFHQNNVIFEQDLVAIEERSLADNQSVDFTTLKELLADLSEGLRCLGSKKLFDLPLELLQERLGRCNWLYQQIEQELHKLPINGSATKGMNHGG
jgi:hypothetical protein